jgi:hypothetical protein
MPLPYWAQTSAARPSSAPANTTHAPENIVIPAKAGIQGRIAQLLKHWIPAFAGMTNETADNALK